MLIVHGGRSDRLTRHFVLSDIHGLLLDTLTWVRIETYGEKNIARSNHCVSLIGSQLLILGGTGKKSKLENQLYTVELDNQRARKIIQ